MSRGLNRERQVAEWLRDRDWFVIRAAGSNGCADLVALRDRSKPLMVEVKSTLTPYSHFGPEARERLSGEARLAGAKASLAWWPSRGELLWIEQSAWPS